MDGLVGFSPSGDISGASPLVADELAAATSKRYCEARLPSGAEWPDLAMLGMDDAEQLRRLQGIGGSDANIILSGNSDRIRQLWLEKRGEAHAADLSGSLQVMLGSWTEAFNRQWYERLTCRAVSQTGASFTCQRHGWRRCTVDGLVECASAVFEAKHTSAFAKPEEVLGRYAPRPSFAFW